MEITANSITLISSSAPNQISLPFSNNFFPISLRIDAVADPKMTIGGLPAMTKLLTMYTDLSAETWVGICDGSTPFPSIFNLNLAPIGAPNFRGVDLAAYVYYTPTGTAQIHAAVVGIEGSDLRVYEIDMTSGSIFASWTLASPATSFMNPRIEAQGMHDGATGTASRWGVVVNDWPNFIRYYSDLNPGGYIANPTMGDTHEYPTIAAGIGKMPTLPLNDGNNQYSYAWGAIDDGNYYAQAADLFGNPLILWFTMWSTTRPVA